LELTDLTQKETSMSYLNRTDPLDRYASTGLSLRGLAVGVLRMLFEGLVSSGTSFACSASAHAVQAARAGKRRR
jgi:hypothetical protein